MGVQYLQIIYNPTILLKLMVTWGFPTKKTYGILMGNESHYFQHVPPCPSCWNMAVIEGFFIR